MKTTYKLLILLIFPLIITSCKGEDAPAAIEKTKRNIQDAITGISEFDYKNVTNSFMNELNTIQRTRAAKTYTLDLNTDKSNLDILYNKLKDFCKNQKCWVKYEKIYKSNIKDIYEYKINITLLQADAESFIDYAETSGAIINKQKIEQDTQIKDTIALQEIELETSKNIKAKIENLQQQNQNSSLKQIENITQIEKYKQELNKNIKYLEESLSFLNQAKDQAKFNISLTQKHNSASSLLKYQMIKSWLLFLGSLDTVLFILIWITMFYLIYLIIKYTKILIIKLVKSMKHNNQYIPPRSNNPFER